MLRFFKRFRTYRSSIHFIYAESYRHYGSTRYYGSTVMRGQQLSEIAKKALPPANKVYFTSSDYSYKRCILLLTKYTIYALSPKALRRLKKKRNRLIFDPIDGPIPADRLKYADIVVAASETIYNDYKKTLPSSIKVVLVNHHADPRIKTLDWSKRPTTLRTGYFGELGNAILTSKIKKHVDAYPVPNTKQDNYWLKKLPEYNLHYAIRQKRDVYPNKPFTKGFTAAHCGANILIQTSEKEAVRWLGRDYPYLLRGKVTEKKILEMLKYAKKSFGSTEWKRGLKIMRGIRDRTSEEEIGKQLVELFAEARRF